MTVGYGKDQPKNKVSPLRRKIRACKASILEQTTRPMAGETPVAMSTYLAPARPLAPRTSQDRKRLPWALAYGLGHGRR
jgi:hypothetical protein